jgi:hypothetical protein
MAGELNLSALRAAGAAITAAPAPAVLEPEDWARSLRARFDPSYRLDLEIEYGVRSRFGFTGSTRRAGPASGQSASTAPFCGDCGALRSASVSDPCRACGSSQPPNLSRMNPRARHMIGESPLR